MKPKGVWVWKNSKFCAKNHLVKVGTLHWCIKDTAYIHKGTQSSTIYTWPNAINSTDIKAPWEYLDFLLGEYGNWTYIHHDSDYYCQYGPFMFTFVVLILQFLFLFAVLVAYFPACVDSVSAVIMFVLFCLFLGKLRRRE